MTHDNGVDADGNDVADTYSLGTSAVSGGEVSSGDVLVADLGSIADADGLDTAKGEDKMLGAVMSNGRVATSDAGVPEAPVDSNVTYQWVRINGMDDDTLDSDDNGTITPAERDDDPEDANNIGMDALYTVVAADIGAKIKVEVTIQDDAHTLVMKAVAEMLDSGAVNVLRTLSITASGTDFAENAGSLGFTVTSDAPVSAALKVSVSVSGPSDLELTSPVDVTIASAASGMSGTVTFSDVEGAQGPRVVTLSLPSSVDGYLISSDMNTAMVTIHDDENSELSGMPTILRLGEAAQTAGSETTDPIETTSMQGRLKR